MSTTDIRVTERLKKGVIIDAPFPENMELAYKVLIKEGQFDQQRDFLHIVEQYDNQLTTVKFNKLTPYRHPVTGEICESRHYTLMVPDRYRPISEVEKLPEDVIRKEEDI